MLMIYYKKFKTKLKRNLKFKSKIDEQNLECIFNTYRPNLNDDEKYTFQVNMKNFFKWFKSKKNVLSYINY